jgi:hypothetical protein
MQTIYPMNLSSSILEIVTNERYNVNDTLQTFQFLYSESKLTQQITTKIRNSVVMLMDENSFPKY